MLNRFIVNFYVKGNEIMYKIVKKKVLNPTVTLMEIDAPLIAKKLSRVSLSFSELTKTASVFRLPLQVMTEKQER